MRAWCSQVMDDPWPPFDDVILLKGHVNCFWVENRVLTIHVYNLTVRAIRRDQLAPEAVPNNPRQFKEHLEDLRVDSEEDPEIQGTHIEVVCNQPESSWRKLFIEHRHRSRSQKLRLKVKSRSSRQGSRASPISGVRSSKYCDSTSSFDYDQVSVPSRRHAHFS